MNGEWVGEVSTFLNSSMINCPKPLVPDSQRAFLPTNYVVDYSPNGQCFPEANTVSVTST